MNELQKTGEMPMEQSAPLHVADMIKSMAAQCDTPDKATALEKVIGLYERMEDRNAERAFNTAFVALQADLPVIVAKTVIPNRGKYERFEDLMTVVAPLLARHGFSVSFSMDFKENRVLENCCLSHVSGHSRSNSFAVRTGKADSDTQADCKAATTAKRNALCNALNIVIRQDCLNEDDDASMSGDAVHPDQAEHLRQRVQEAKADEKKFLQYAGAKSFDEIPAARYQQLLDMLEARERKAAGK